MQDRMHRARRFGWIGLVLAISAGCKPAQPVPPVESPSGAPWFVDATKELGLDFVHEAGPTGTYFFPQIMGSGAALFDFDNDGRLDIYLVQNGGPKSKATNRLYHQEPDGHFTDVSAGSGLDVAGYGMGVAIGDVNNDGLPDVLLTEYGRIRLFSNQGHGKFKDVTKESGLDDPSWATSASFVDYDRDGWLDLVVVNYVEYDEGVSCSRQGRPDYCHPKVFPGSVPRLFHNLGGQGKGLHFEDVTVASGLGRLPGPGLGVICADFDGDRWPDIFIANDSKANWLWINQHDGTFKEEAVSRGVAYNGMAVAEANMGVALGDVDGDGLFDLVVTHLATEHHTLWRQGPRGLFQDFTAARHLANTPYRGTGFGVALADFDNDGTLDLAVANGAVSLPETGFHGAGGSFWNSYAQRNQLFKNEGPVFKNEGPGNFLDVSRDNPGFCGGEAVSRALVYGDLQNRGALDLLVTEIAGPARIFRNVAAPRGHWLSVRAIDPALKRDAYGAEIAVEAGGRPRFGLVNPGSSYLSSNDPRVHFGLGNVTQVEAIRIVWPDGREEKFPGGPADRHLTLRKGEGQKP